jgi:hypothetical protein
MRKVQKSCQNKWTPIAVCFLLKLFLCFREKRKKLLSIYFVLVCWSPKGKQLVICCKNNKLQLIDRDLNIKNNYECLKNDLIRKKERDFFDYIYKVYINNCIFDAFLNYQI